MLKTTIADVKTSANPAGATVTADVVLAGKSRILVRDVPLYRGGRLVDEIWQIDPKLGR